MLQTVDIDAIRKRFDEIENEYKIEIRKKDKEIAELKNEKEILEKALRPCMKENAKEAVINYIKNL